MAVKQVEYLFSVNKYKEPIKYTGDKAAGTLLVRLILMEPGTDPAHPLMGFDVKKYRYALGKVDEMRDKLESQIQTYLPDFQNATVAIVIENKLCNIHITNGDKTYIYESKTAPVPIELTDIQNN